MKADMDDAPEYLRQSKRQDGPWRMLAILGIGSAVTWTFIALFAKPIVIDVTQLRKAIHIGDQPTFNHTAEPYSAPSVPLIQLPPLAKVREPTQPLSKAEVEWFEQESARAEEIIQNKFDDRNYKPRTAINTMPPPPQQYYASSKKTPQKRSARQTHSSRWRRENGYNKRVVSGSFEWVAIDDSIDYNSVCQNYRRGSLIYRDCRKGAKVAFKIMCGSYRPACHAENNFMP